MSEFISRYTKISASANRSRYYPEPDSKKTQSAFEKLAQPPAILFAALRLYARSSFRVEEEKIIPASSWF